MFEFTRKKFERTINKKGYFAKMTEKYPLQTKSLELLNSFRNTIHQNGKWDKE